MPFLTVNFLHSEISEQCLAYSLVSVLEFPLESNLAVCRKILCSYPVITFLGNYSMEMRIQRKLFLTALFISIMVNVEEI